jgi:hypothetical protein
MPSTANDGTKGRRGARSSVIQSFTQGFVWITCKFRFSRTQEFQFFPPKATARCFQVAGAEYSKQQIGGKSETDGGKTVNLEPGYRCSKSQLSFFSIQKPRRQAD